MKKGIHIIHIFTVVIFIMLISFPLLNGYFELVKEVENTENRTKVKRPVFSIHNLDKYTVEFDSYYNDNFSFRNTLISFFNKLQFRLFKVSPVPNLVTIGSDGWLFASKSRHNYIGLNQFSPGELEKLKKELITRTKWCSSKGIKYYVVIVPNKMNMYSSFLPRNIVKKRDSSRYDQFVALKNTEGIKIIDVRENMLTHLGGGHYLYQKTDDHWNELGAYYGYEAIMNKVSVDFPSLKPIPISNFEISEYMKSGNMAFLSNLESYYVENYVQLTQRSKSKAVDGVKFGYPCPETISIESYEIVKVNSSASHVKCLVIRDSFGLFLVKFFKNHFQKLVLIHDEWKYRMREDIVNQESPDIIINIILETYIDELIKNPFMSSQFD